MDPMERIKQATGLLMDAFREDNGENVVIEDGEETVGIFNDGILRLGKDGRTVQVHLWLGQPYKINAYLTEPEGEEEA